MYQERQVNEHAFRALRSRVRWAAIISRISYGRQVGPAMDRAGECVLQRRRLTLTLPRSQKVIMRVERFIPRARTAQRLESSTRANWNPYLVPETWDPLSD